MKSRDRKLFGWISICFAFCLISVLPAHAFRADEEQAGYLAKAPAVSRQGEPTVLQKKLFNEAEKAGLTIRRLPARSTPHSIRGTDLGKSSFSGVPGKSAARMTGNVRQDAVSVLDNLSGLFGIGKAADEFTFKSEQSDNLGFKHVRLNQLHRGLRVVGREMIVHFDRNSKAYEANGQYIPGITVGITPLLKAADAERTAREGLVPLGFTKNVLLQQQPLLVVFAMNSDPTLAYELTLRADNPYPAIWRVWIDARTSETLLRYNDIKTINPPSNNGSAATITGNILTGEGGGAVNVSGWRENTGYYYLYNKTSYWYVYNVAASGYSDANTYAYRTNATWGASDRSEISAGRNFDMVQSYFRNVHGRNSFNNNNAYACANVHEDINYVNAYWDGTDFHFGDGDGVMANSLAVLDVCGHEFTHAVTENTAGLWYVHEYGALNESFSDIFSACIEFYSQSDGRSVYPNKIPGYADWLCGEDSWLESVALRDMKSPSNIATVGAGNEQPSRYRGSYWFYGTWDQGGVHINSGVQNFFFYLLSDGGSGVNDGISYSVNGIGIINAGKVAYRALTYYCHEGTDYLLVRDAWRSAAADINSGWVGSVDAAWNAVGCVLPPGDPNADSWDPGDDTGAGATQLNEPIDITQYHGQHVLTENDRYDWFKVYLTVNNEYIFYADYGGEVIGELYTDPEGHNIVEGAYMDHSYKTPLFYRPSVSGWYYLRISGIYPTAEYTLCYNIFDTVFPVPPPGSPLIAISTNAVNVPEGGSVTFRLKLYRPPTDPITMIIARSSGDTDITVSGANPYLFLMFDSKNWDTYQTVTLNAAEDADTVNGTASILCLAAIDEGGGRYQAVDSLYLAATEIDNDVVISGYVKTSNGVAVSNVAINFSNNGGSVTNNAAGCYTQIVTKGWSGAVTPSKSGYTFSPASRSYSNVQSNYPAQDYTASIAQVKITGYVNTSAGVGVDRVTLTFNNGGGTAATDISGFYAKYLTSGWSGVVTPSKTGYTFNPASRNYSNVRTNQVNQNYTAMVPVVTGAIVVSTGAITIPEGKTATFQVKLNTKPTANITVNVARYSGDSDISVSGGASLTFTPVNWNTYQTVTLAAAEDADAINGAAIIRCSATGWTGKDMNAVEADNDIVTSLAISGYVKTSAGVAVSGVTINFSNNGGSVGTDAGGYYSRAVTKGWSGTATPSKSGCTFSPSSRSYSNVQSNYSAQDFTATIVEIMPNPYSVTVPEGETATFNVKLSLQPAANLTVNVARYSGDSDISIKSGASLTFTPANWNTYQTVTLAAAEDSDTTDGTAIIRCSASGLASKDVTAFELDNDIFYNISGYIKDQYGKVATGAEVDFYDSRGDILMAKTDAKGYYAGLLYRGWSGEAWPFCTGVDTFSPAFRTYSNLTANKTNQNYTACKGVPGPDPMPKLAPSAVDTFGRDIDGDGLMDPAVYCEANGVWDSLLSASEYEHKTISMGGSGYKAALADFDGDQRADLALYRASDGLFVVALSGDNYQTYWMHIGGEGYVLVPGDYDGDGKADPAVYQSASGSWRAQLSSANYADVALDFGGPQYRAVPGDYDGDGKTDPAICDEQAAVWVVKYSAANYAEASGIFGHSGGKAVPADYDGDGKTDPAMYFDTNGSWEVWHSGNGYALAGYSWLGGDGFVPIPGDYDGDGLADPAVYNPETGQWRALLSGQGYTQRVEYLGKPVSLPVGMPP